MTSTDRAERGEPVARQRLVVVDGLIYPVGPVPPQYRSPGIRRLLKLSVKASVDVNPTRKSWEKPDEIEVFKAASQVSHNMGGIAWSLNLSQKKIQQLKKTRSERE